MWHRFLCIMLGFWVCSAVTVFITAPIAALLHGLPAGLAFTADPSAPRYLWANVSLLG